MQFMDGRIVLRCGDMKSELRRYPDNFFHSIVTDPPYHLQSIVARFGKEGSTPPGYGTDGAFARSARGFMGQQWDGGDIAHDPETWAEIIRVLRPGGHMIAFSSTRTYHRMACAIEDAGFEIRDQLGWAYGSGMPKSQNVAMFIDRKFGVKGSRGDFKTPEHAVMVESGVKRDDTEDGWKRPWMKDQEAVEEYARQYLPASPEAREWNGWGTALTPAWEPICLARKPLSEKTIAENVLQWGCGGLNIDGCRIAVTDSDDIDPSKGRWPKNVIHDGGDEVVTCFPRDTARLFYCPKASKVDRAGSDHPTVKPVELMRYLVRLITPKGCWTCDPFAGSGTTGAAALLEDVNCVLVEQEPDYQLDICRRFE